MKEISEKTFELNITRELLDTASSYVFYITHPFVQNLMDPQEWSNVLKNAVFFGEGLTQKQESKKGGGYDVSINYGLNGVSSRLLFLQYKSGIRASYCENESSQFHGSLKDKKTHIVFTFNDAANCTQHSILRNLAREKEIVQDSVLYVFPRITEREEFIKNSRNLIPYTSFVPVLEIDRQAAEQTPPIEVKDAVVHKYRTSYDGDTNEVNYYYFYFYYNKLIISYLISELICVQVERLFLFLKNNKNPFTPEIFYMIKNFKDRIQTPQGNLFQGVSIVTNMVTDYIDQFEINGLKSTDLIIPKAPEKYTIEIPPTGFIIKMNQRFDLGSVNYQIF